MGWSDRTFGLDTKEVGIAAGLSAGAIALGIFFLIRRRKNANEEADREAGDLSHSLRAQRLAKDAQKAHPWVTIMKWCLIIPLLWPIALLIAPLWWQARNTLADVEEEKPHLKVHQPEKSHPSQSHFQNQSLPSLRDPSTVSHHPSRGRGRGRGRGSVKSSRGRGRGSIKASRGIHSKGRGSYEGG